MASGRAVGWCYLPAPSPAIPSGHPWRQTEVAQAPSWPGDHAVPLRRLALSLTCYQVRRPCVPCLGSLLRPSSVLQALGPGCIPHTGCPHPRSSVCHQPGLALARHLGPGPGLAPRRPPQVSSPASCGPCVSAGPRAWPPSHCPVLPGPPQNGTCGRGRSGLRARAPRGHWMTALLKDPATYDSRPSAPTRRGTGRRCLPPAREQEPPGPAGSGWLFVAGLTPWAPPGTSGPGQTHGSASPRPLARPEPLPSPRCRVPPPSPPGTPGACLSRRA